MMPIGLNLFEVFESLLAVGTQDIGKNPYRGLKTWPPLTRAVQQIQFVTEPRPQGSGSYPGLPG